MDPRNSSQRGHQYYPAPGEIRFSEISAPSMWYTPPHPQHHHPQYSPAGPYGTAALPSTLATSKTAPSAYKPDAASYPPPPKPSSTTQTQPSPQPVTTSALRLHSPSTSSSIPASAAQVDVEVETAPGEEEDKDDEATPENRYRVTPPPEQAYPNLQAAEEALREWMKMRNYELVRQKSDKNRENKAYKHYYRCGNYGKPSNTRKITEETRIRKRKSKKSGCTMALYLKAVHPLAVDAEWEVKHHQNEKSFYHNHPPPEPVVKRKPTQRKNTKNKGTQTPITMLPKCANCSYR